MEIVLKRIARRETYTIGHLYVDGNRVCDVIEDKDRGLKQEMSLSEIRSKKVYGETAIPAGRYRVRMDIQSPKYLGKMRQDPYYNQFAGYMPRLENVKGYDGVLMHPGSTAADSLGCLIVGENKAVGKVLNSRVTFVKLYNLLEKAHKAGEQIYITIT